jgi:predicted NBD/HSP70 family sugar kinase
VKAVRTSAAAGLNVLRELVEQGDPGATRVVSDAGRAIGRVLADLVNHLNPAAVIVGGALVGLAA